MPVVIVNTLIGIIQEIRSKKTLDKLTLLSEPRADVLRDGKVISVPSSELVLDDVVIFSAGKQICADADILEGEVQVNEALITGEPDEITKTAGDELLSGSFIISGSCKARLTRVGADSFASRLTLEAKKMKKRHRSEMMHSLTRLVQVIGLLIFPVGIALLQPAFRSEPEYTPERCYKRGSPCGHDTRGALPSDNRRSCRQRYPSGPKKNPCA